MILLYEVYFYSTGLDKFKGKQHDYISVNNNCVFV